MTVRPISKMIRGRATARSADGTRAFYEEHASDYAAVTLGLGIGPAMSEFALRLKRGESIVDLGCGAGRDLESFRRLGLKAVGLDYSFGLCVIARRHSGAPVVLGDIRSLPFASGAFSGASAVASLLHLRRSEMLGALGGINRVLKPNGLLLTTMKRGSGEHQDRNGRWFSYFDPEEWIGCLETAGFSLIEVNLDREQRKGGSMIENIAWINCLCRKTKL